MARRHFRRGIACTICKVDFWTKTTTYNDNAGTLDPIWECPNCGQQDARKVQQRGTEQTPAQTRTIDRVVRALRKPTGLDTFRYEVKEQKVEMDKTGSAWLTVTVGMPGDENTMASIYCRDRLFVCIGRAGGMRGWDKDTNKKVKGRRVLWTCVTH